jgi:hypothetical protein
MLTVEGGEGLELHSVVTPKLFGPGALKALRLYWLSLTFAILIRKNSIAVLIDYISAYK